MVMEDSIKVTPEYLECCITVAEAGTEMMRVKGGRVGAPRLVKLASNKTYLQYSGTVSCVPDRFKRLRINEILEIRSGWNTDNFNKSAAVPEFSSRVKESCCFSIIFRHSILFQKSIDFVVRDPADQKAWVTCLKDIIAKLRQEVVHFNEETWLRKQFAEADENKNGVLSFKELWNLLCLLNIEIDQSYAKKIFKKSDFHKSSLLKEDGLDIEEFLKFFEALTSRHELEEIMNWYSSVPGGTMIANDLKDFLAKEQGLHHITIADCEQIITKFEPFEKNRKDKLFSVNGFRKLLSSHKYGHIIKLEETEVYQDMTLPLCNYFINSSHNTYLIGNQLRGDSSVEGYINALKMGAKLLELDIWDGANEEPVITHGHTLVNPINLVDALAAILKYAFIHNDYPVILSIENHCTLPVQQRMAIHFANVFGDVLYIPQTESDLDHMAAMSPTDLQRKILLKAKKVDRKLEQDSVDSGQIGIEVEMSEDETDDAPATPLPASRKKNGNLKKGSLAFAFSDLVALPSRSVKVIPDGLAACKPYNFVSFTENKLLAAFESVHQYDIAKYAGTHIVKVYPKGLRTDSSNLDPIPHWIHGISCVTLNMQTPSMELDLNCGFFLQNGNSSYCLKPKILREGMFITNAELLARPHKLVLHVLVISAQYLPKPSLATDNDIVDPYVTVETHGYPCDCYKQKTKVITNNGFNPVWDEQMSFYLRSPETTLIRFAVKDYDIASQNDFIGQFTVPVQSLAQGYRHIRLRTGFTRELDNAAAVNVRIKMRHVVQDAVVEHAV